MDRPRIDVRRLERAARERFVMSARGPHGPSHWERVRENGLRIAEHTGADAEIVEAFALLHDCCRESEGVDPEHGQRAAEFASSLRGTLIHIEDEEFERLTEALRDHSRGKTSRDVQIGTCWDADRLDLGRVGRKPKARLMSTEYARRSKIIRWAYRRSRSRGDRR